MNSLKHLLLKALLIILFIFINTQAFCSVGYKDSRIDTLAQRIKAFANNDSTFALEIIKEFETYWNNNSDIAEEDVIGLLNSMTRFFPEQGTTLEQIINSRFEKTNNCKGKSILSQFKGLQNLSAGKTEEARTIFYKAMEYDSICNDEILKAINRGFLANSYYYDGDYKIALQLMEKSYVVYVQQKDTSQIIPSLINQGATHKILEHTHTAAGLFKLALNYAENYSESTDDAKAMIRNNIAAILNINNQFDLSEKMYLQNIAMYDTSNYVKIPPWYLLAYMNLAGLNITLNNKDLYFKHIKKCEEYIPVHPYYLRTYLPTRIKGAIKYETIQVAKYWMQKLDSLIIKDGNNIDFEYLETHQYFYNKYKTFCVPPSLYPVIEDIAYQSDDFLLRKNAMVLLFYKAKTTGNYKLMSTLSEKIFSLESTLDTIKNNNIMADMAAQYRLQEMEEKYLGSENEKIVQQERADMYKYVLIISSFLIIILLINIFISFRNYKRRNLLNIEQGKMNASRNILLEAENILLQQKQKQIQSEHEFEKNKISYAQDLLNQLNTLIQGLESLIAGTETETSRKIREYKQGLINLRQTHIQNDLFIQKSKDLLSEMEMEIRKKLGEHADTLSPSEFQVLVLSKEGYIIKDISARTGLSVSYIENIRSNIRKKLNIPSNMSIQEYLVSL